jgi:hypothetical protein
MKIYGQLEISRMAFDGENERRFVDADDAEEMLKMLKKSLSQMHDLSLYESYFWPGEKLALARHVRKLQEIISKQELAYCFCDETDKKLAAFEGSTDKMIRCPYKKDSQGRCTSVLITPPQTDNYD